MHNLDCFVKTVVYLQVEINMQMSAEIADLFQMSCKYTYFFINKILPYSSEYTCSLQVETEF